MKDLFINVVLPFLLRHIEQSDHGHRMVTRDNLRKVFKTVRNEHRTGHDIVWSGE